MARWGLRCELSGDLALFLATKQAGRKGETAKMATSSEGLRENLLDLKPQSLLSVLPAPTYPKEAVFLSLGEPNFRSQTRRFVAVGVATFFLSVLISLGSQTLLTFFSLFPALILLLVIVGLGIIFDIIGVAVTAAREEPFHAMAVDRVSGAQQAIRLVRHADKVATFTNDMIGDVAGTLSGAVAAAVVMRLLLLRPGLKEPVMTTLMVALIAALTVAGKACGKVIALNNAHDIVLVVGRLLYWLEKGTGIAILAKANRRSKDNKKRTRKGKRGE
jgi:hypothetical protein